MSHNDYTKYARENRVEPTEVEAEVKPIPVENPVVESEPAPVVEPALVEPEVVETETVEAPRKMGRVIGCARLNVRKAPKPRAEVVCEIECGIEVEIDEENSTVDFYKVYTASGIEGYCVKTYIDENSQK